MRKLALGLIAFVLLVNSAFGQARLRSADLEFVGIKHNQMLDRFYNKAVAERWTAADKQEATDFLISEITRECQSSAEATMARDHITQRMATPSTIAEPSSTIFAPGLPEKVKVHLRALDNISYNGGNNLANFHRQVVALENNIDRDAALNNKDLLVLYTATNVAKYSATYWAGNRDRWVNYGGTNPPPVAAKMGPGGRIGGMDVAGAVGAAAGAAAVNIVIGPGQVAYGGAILGGAVAGSVGQAVYEVWDWAFG